MTLENKRYFRTTLKLKQTKLVCKLAPRKKTKRGITESLDYFEIETKESSLQTKSKKDN